MDITLNRGPENNPDSDGFYDVNEVTIRVRPSDIKGLIVIHPMQSFMALRAIERDDGSIRIVVV